MSDKHPVLVVRNVWDLSVFLVIDFKSECMEVRSRVKMKDMEPF